MLGIVIVLVIIVLVIIAKQSNKALKQDMLITSQDGLEDCVKEINDEVIIEEKVLTGDDFVEKKPVLTEHIKSVIEEKSVVTDENTVHVKTHEKDRKGTRKPRVKKSNKF